MAEVPIFDKVVAYFNKIFVRHNTISFRIKNAKNITSSVFYVCNNMVVFHFEVWWLTLLNRRLFRLSQWVHLTRHVEQWPSGIQTHDNFDFERLFLLERSKWFPNKLYFLIKLDSNYDFCGGGKGDLRIDISKVRTLFIVNV